MSPAEFAQIQQAVISQMTQAPQTLGGEASQLSKDFDRGNMRFDSRDKVVAQIKLLTPQNLPTSSIRRWWFRKAWRYCPRFPAARMARPITSILKVAKSGKTSAHCRNPYP